MEIGEEADDADGSGGTTDEIMWRYVSSEMNSVITSVRLRRGYCVKFGHLNSQIVDVDAQKNDTDVAYHVGTEMREQSGATSQEYIPLSSIILPSIQIVKSENPG